MDADITIFAAAAVAGKRQAGPSQKPALGEAGLGGRARERGRGGQTRAELSSLHWALPLAIRMEGNTVDRSKVTLDSSKLFFNGQVEEPGGESGVGSDSSFIFHLLPKHVKRYHSPNTNCKVGKLGKGEMNVNRTRQSGGKIGPKRLPYCVLRSALRA